MPNPQPYGWAHMGRACNTDYPVKLLQYKQRKDADYVRSIEFAKERMAKDAFSIKFDKHSVKRRFQCEIQKRLRIRLQHYEDSIDKRREKSLRELFAEEEKEFIRETVDLAQRGGESRMELMKRRASELIAVREAEREEIVKKKRLQQYMQRCTDLRGALAQKNLIDCKSSQLQQIRESEARRDVERERDQMWNDLKMKEIQAQREREEYDALDRYIRDKNIKDVWDMQVQGKELSQAEAARISVEDRIELDKLAERMRKEELDALIERRRKRDFIDKELREQVETQHKFLDKREKEEKALVDAFTLLAQMELDKERAKIQDTTTVAKKEMAQYRKNLAELEQQRKEEDERLDELRVEYQTAIQRKQDEAKCKILAAKKKLQEDVLKGRAGQIEEKRAIAEEQLKMQQEENELTKYACEANERLLQETKRQEVLAKEQYKNDLLKQIEYNKVLQERERQELEKQLAIGKVEEERYEQMLRDMCDRKIVGGEKHPFKRILERYDCHCE